MPPKGLMKGTPEMIAYMQSLRQKRKMKSGKGILDSVKNLAKTGLKKGVDMGADYLKSKVDGMGLKKTRKGKGLLGDIGKTVLRTGLNMAPIPGLVKDVGENVGNLLIDKSGLGIDMSKMIGKNKSVMVKKVMTGSALRPMGY